MTSNTTIPIFSSPICMNTFQLDEHETELIKQEKCFFNKFSDKDGLMSVNRKILNKYPKLKNVCMTHIKSFIFDELNYKRDVNYTITTSWLNDHPPNHSAHKHSHANSMFSGVLYLDVPENSGSIIFEKPSAYRTIEPKVNEWNVLNSRSWWIEPHKGMCIIFPSHLEHYVEVNRTQQHRYSIAFDVMVESFEIENWVVNDNKSY